MVSAHSYRFCRGLSDYSFVSVESFAGSLRVLQKACGALWLGVTVGRSLA